MFEILFKIRKTGQVVCAVTDVSLIRYITQSEIGFTYRDGRNSSCSFPQTESLEVNRIDSITDERQKQIEAATKENPVRLTVDEVQEMAEARAHRFQCDVGAGKFLLPAAAGSLSAAAHAMKDKGYSNASIAKELSISETKLTRLLSQTYLP